MLTLQDLNNLTAFLARVDLKGSEAMAMAELQLKLKAMASELTKSEAPKPDEE